MDSSPLHHPDYYPARILVALVAGVALFLLAGFLPFPEGLDPYPARMAGGVTAFVAVLWLGNAMPMGAASLFPIALMPALGVLPIGQAASSYAHPILWLFFGGFVLALGIERWGLHRRIALVIIAWTGVKPAFLVLGFMLSSAFLSMWLMNTSTTLMLLPIAMALVDSMKRSGAVTEEGSKNFAFTLLVGIAYAASIGGTATPIGTAPNGIYLSAYGELEAQGAPPMSFLLWMAFAIPLVMIMIPAVWLLLTRVLAPVEGGDPLAAEILAKERDELPKMDKAEKSMLWLFVLAAVLWTTRRDLDLGELGFIPGWWRLLPVPDARYVGDGAVAVFVGLLAFVLPSGKKRGQALMDWPTARRMPWEILFLLGGGIAIARAFKETGLAAAVGGALEPVVGQLHPLLMIVIVCTVMTFLTEVTSNTAMTSLMLPILAAACTVVGMDPRLLMLPATLSASCAFMLPIATPPNAIVFSSGQIPMQRMAKVGFWLNLVGIVVITMVVWFLAAPLLGIDTTSTPEWLTQAAGE